MLQSHTMLANRYEILEQIGTGGMSDVYSAKDHSLDREVAVKVLKEEYAKDTQFVSKFRAEAQAAAGLEHPNIVNIYDVGNENGLYYIVMEKVEGITLKTYIAKKGQLSYNEVISIAIQVGRGIEAAHNKGIVHRDIKPQNIMISKEGKVKVTDFGIARAASSNTLSADPMGSVHYSSPEQVRGGFSNYQSDLYSLGIVMYEMCTGRVPFDGDTAVSIAIQHLQSEMQPPSVYAPNLPISIEKIIKKCTMKSPDRRYATMEELLIDLKKALVSPDEDFVVISEPTEGDKTRPISESDLARIREHDAAQAADAKSTQPLADNGDDDDYDDDDDGDISSGLDKAFNIMGIAAAVVILGIFVFLVASFTGVLNTFNIGGSSTEQQSSSEALDEQVEMISLLGMTELEAKTKLRELELGYKNNGTESSDEYEKGQICRQDVEAGTMIDKNTTIRVSISSGKGDLSIPNVIGQTETVAKRMLEDKGFEVASEYYPSDAEKDTVFEQTPSAGSKGQEGDTVTIKVSQGEEQVKIPDISSLNVTNAVRTLESAGFVVNTVNEASSDIREGEVIGTDPSADTYATKGSEVTLKVSAGPEVSYYNFSYTVEPMEGSVTTYTLVDNNNKTIGTWTVDSTKVISANDIETPSGELSYTYDVETTDEEGNVSTQTMTGAYDVTFTKQ